MNAPQPITIVGGGLAGLSLGVALCRVGVPVEIREAGSYPRHRVCGEFLTGLEDRTIERLGIAAAFARAGTVDRMTWYRRDKEVAQPALPAPARTLSRFSLDASLADLFVAAGGRLVTQARVAPAEFRPGWVCASGRRRHGGSRWFGLKLHLRNRAPARELEMHFGDHAYVGLAPVEDGWTNVCGLFRRRPGLPIAGDDALPAVLRASGLPALAERIAGAEVRAGSRFAVAGFAFDRRVPARVGVSLGDACAAIPPFTGHGMAMAFISAELALGPLVAWSRGLRSWEDISGLIRASLAAEFRVRLAVAATLHPFLLSRAGQFGLGAAIRAGLLPVRSLYQLLH